MKKYNLIIISLILAIGFSCNQVYGQASVANIVNLPTAANQFLGWNAGAQALGYNWLTIGTFDNTVPTRIPILFYTNGLNHAQLDVLGNYSTGWTNSNNYYGIYNGATVDPVLWHNNIPGCIYVKTTP